MCSRCPSLGTWQLQRPQAGRHIVPKVCASCPSPCFRTRGRSSCTPSAAPRSKSLRTRCSCFLARHSSGPRGPATSMSGQRRRPCGAWDRSSALIWRRCRRGHAAKPLARRLHLLRFAKKAAPEQRHALPHCLPPLQIRRQQSRQRRRRQHCQGSPCPASPVAAICTICAGKSLTLPCVRLPQGHRAPLSATAEAAAHTHENSVQPLSC
mmetsp:Transcript_74938/g.243465  ORF Transcript_74938/g.243465 Transcript_74938/m.243465 type:complete len:209 (-) Transcript_74938:38-664(-)